MLAILAKTLIKERKTIAVAESCTGGLISHTLTSISGSSKYFKLGVVAYSNKTKSDILNIPLRQINKFGAVSTQTAKKMAQKIKIKGKTDIGLACTGIAGPTGGTKTKPVGTVFIAIADKNKCLVRKFQFKGNRIQIKNKTKTQSLLLIKKCLKNL